MVAHNKKALAKSMYIHENYTVAEISEATGINVHTLKFLISKGSKGERPWKELKKLGRDNDLLEVLNSEETDLNSIYSLGLSVVQRSLAKIELSGEQLDVRGIDKLLSALDRIDRWRRLEEVKEEVDADNLNISDIDLDINNHVFFKKAEGDE